MPVVKVGDHELELTNLDKVLYPETGFTKGDVVEYYARIGPVLLPHIAGRPLTLKRYPNGVTAKHFYEKRCPAYRPGWLPTARMWSDRHGGWVEYCAVDDLASLVWVANTASLEIHPTLARAPAVDRPTSIVFDLDPGAPAGVVECAQVALLLREAFDAVGLLTFAKASGSKGVQVYVPLNTPVTYEDTKAVARGLAEVLERTHPDLVVSSMKKELRTGKVLVDWSQNDEHKSTVAAYSLRAKTGRPTVSLPLTWDEVEDVAAGNPSVTVAGPGDALTRVEHLGDLFAPVNDLEQALNLSKMLV